MLFEAVGIEAGGEPADFGGGHPVVHRWPLGEVADAATDGETDAAPGDGFKRRVERYEAALIVEALRSTGGSQTEAARVLQLPLRTLQHKIKALGIKRLGWG